MKISRKNFMRIIAILIGSFCIASFLVYTTLMEGYKSLEMVIRGIIFCVLMFFSVVYAQIRPLDFRLYVVWTFVFSFLTISFGSSALGMVILFSAFFLAKKICFFKNYKAIKIIFVMVLFVASILSLVRFDKFQYIRMFIEMVAVLTTFVILFFVNKYFKAIMSPDEMNDTEDNLDSPKSPSDFNEFNFSERDKKILHSILKGEKYEAIAINLNVSASLIKQRVAYLYKELNVSGQIDFLIKYGNK